MMREATPIRYQELKCAGSSIEYCTRRSVAWTPRISLGEITESACSRAAFTKHAALCAAVESCARESDIVPTARTMYTQKTSNCEAAASSRYTDSTAPKKLASLRHGSVVKILSK